MQQQLAEQFASNTLLTGNLASARTENERYQQQAMLHFTETRARVQALSLVQTQSPLWQTRYNEHVIAVSTLNTQVISISQELMLNVNIEKRLAQDLKTAQNIHRLF